ncbi:SAGA-associated factor 29, partial [Rissa tridactyla]|uniref:SAGA-associated factor 29 n=1 Tax=Rissa tridactyla TaxID=75485 RepID=UPI0023BA7C80
MALVSADSRIAELLGELHQLIKQTQEERSRSEHNLVNIQKTHERMQTENKISPYYRTKLRGLYTTAKADAEAECNILRKALDKIAEIKSLLEERRIAAKIAGIYSEAEPPRKTMRRGVLMTLLQQSAMTLPLWIGKPGENPPPLCGGGVPAAGDYVARPGGQSGRSGEGAGRGRAMDPGRGRQLQPRRQQVRSGRHRRRRQRAAHAEPAPHHPPPPVENQPRDRPRGPFHQRPAGFGPLPPNHLLLTAPSSTPPPPAGETTTRCCSRTRPTPTATRPPSTWPSATWWPVGRARRSERGGGGG